MIEIQKHFFVLELEQGKDVTIPKILSQDDLSQSFRYYDSIIHMIQSSCSKDKRNILSLQMSLSKFYDKQYSNMKVLSNVKFFGKSKNNEQDLNDLLKDDPNDFNDEAAGIVEKNAISYANSLHTTHLQRGRFVRIDDNLLNIQLMNNE